MITVYFEKPMGRHQALSFHDAIYADIKGDYLVLTAPVKDKIGSYQEVGIFLMKNVLGWAKK